MKQLTLFDAIEIELTQGYYTFIDPIDSDLAQYKWWVKFGNGGTYATRKISINGKMKATHLHNVILERIMGRLLSKGEIADHIDLNPLNNTRCNLRVATVVQNRHNLKRRSTNKSGYKGVWWDKQYKIWRAEATADGKRINLGRFDNPEDAYAAYCAAELKNYGEFARLE